VRQFVTAAAEGRFPAHLVTEEMIDTLAIAGSPEHCREGLAKIIDAGVTAPVAFEIPGVSPENLLRNVHTHLMPYFL
jgi:alkanesulfonate monooxygenase SsuD/methylene tetrahydromethanopterin reductase-like flavin-dependent oxidoreductase (luciferase family)